MKTFDKAIETAVSTIMSEGRAICKLADYVNEEFQKVVLLLHECRGRVIVTGVGKSAIIGQKIVATFNSTGTPSIFMHAADAIHGDLGIVQPDDVVIVLSKSGNTPEIKVLVPLLKAAGNTLIALVGNVSSYLAAEADYLVNCTVEKEACPNNLAPTTSTTAQLVMGDALAICLLEARGFSSSDFARYHPGGALGKKLYLKVSELARNNQVPQVSSETPVKEVIMEISEKRLGATAVIDNGEIVGIVTDGDIRRMLEKNENFSSLKAKHIMGRSPRTIEASDLAVNALRVFQDHNVTQLIVTNNGHFAGFIHFHDLMREGII